MDITHTNHSGLLAGKVAFVSGAGRGIGAAAARLFAREGARVLLAARTSAQLATVTDEIRQAGGEAEYAVCDLADGDSVRAAVELVVATWAAQRPRVLCHRRGPARRRRRLALTAGRHFFAPG